MRSPPPVLGRAWAALCVTRTGDLYDPKRFISVEARRSRNTKAKTKTAPSANRSRADFSFQSNNPAQGFATVSPPLWQFVWTGPGAVAAAELQVPKRTKWVKYFVPPVLRYIFVGFISMNKVLTFMVNRNTCAHKKKPRQNWRSESLNWRGKRRGMSEVAELCHLKCWRASPMIV